MPLLLGVDYNLRKLPVKNIQLKALFELQVEVQQALRQWICPAGMKPAAAADKKEDCITTGEGRGRGLHHCIPALQEQASLHLAVLGAGLDGQDPVQSPTIPLFLGRPVFSLCLGDMVEVPGSQGHSIPTLGH